MYSLSPLFLLFFFLSDKTPKMRADLINSPWASTVDFGKEPFDTSPQRTHRRKNCPFRMRVCVCAVSAKIKAPRVKKKPAPKKNLVKFFTHIRTHGRCCLTAIYIFFGTSHTSGVRARMRFTNECSFCWVVYLRGTPCVFNVKMRVVRK